MSLYIKKGSNNIYFSDLIILADKNGAPYCIFTTLDSFDVGDILILYINDNEYLRFRVYRIKEFKEMGEPIYYQVIALHLSDVEWQFLMNTYNFEIGLQRDFSDSASGNAVYLYKFTIDVFNLGLAGFRVLTPTSIPSAEVVISENIKCLGDIDALKTKMTSNAPYSIIVKDENKIQLEYDSQITNTIDISDWIPYESYEKWIDPSGEKYENRVKYYIKEGHFTTFYYAGEKYDDGANIGNINTLIIYKNKTEIYDVFNPPINRVQITGEKVNRQIRTWGESAYTSLNFTDNLSCVTFKKTLTSWSSGENNKQVVTFSAPNIVGKNYDGNKLKANKLVFRFMDNNGSFPGNIISANDITFYIKVYKNNQYVETLTIKKTAPLSSAIVRPTSSDYMSTYGWVGTPNSKHYKNVNEVTSDEDSSYNYKTILSGGGGISRYWSDDSVKSLKWNIESITYYVRSRITTDISNVKGRITLYKTTGETYHGDFFNMSTSYQYITYTQYGLPGSIDKWSWSNYRSIDFGAGYQNNSGGYNVEVRETHCYYILNFRPTYHYIYTIEPDNFYTFEFYHNKSPSLSNIHIIGSLTNFEEI